MAMGRALRAGIALGAALVIMLALIQVTTVGPRVTVRWQGDVTDPRRSALEAQYGLAKGERIEDTPTGWRYQLENTSPGNVEALVRDPAVVDTGYIDRETFAVDPSTTTVTIRRLPLPFPFSVNAVFRDPWQLFQIQSLFLLIAGGAVLWASRDASPSRRRGLAIATLAAVVALGWTFPISPDLATMGDASQVVNTRRDWEAYAGVDHLRFEAHLTYMILGRLDRLYGLTNDSPEQALMTLSRGATAWFALCALAVGFLEQWSARVLRYIGLALLAPAALLLFGWREVGHLSLNIAMFPLLVRGLRTGGWQLDAAACLAGLGAALHGWGLVSLGGALIAALAAPAPLTSRVNRLFRIAAAGTAAYTGWIAIDVILLKLPISIGHAVSIPWRPWLTDGVFEGRLNAAVFSARGARDIAMTEWIVGAPLLIVAAGMWRRWSEDVRTAFSYAIPSVLVATFMLHSQGLAEDMDVVVAVFPALYAMAWVCANEERRTSIAAALLVSAHLGFWRVLLDENFRNAPLS
jgi:hypothetical protein